MAKLAKIYTNNPHNGLGNITLIMFLQGWISAEQYSSMLGTNILKFLFKCQACIYSFFAFKKNICHSYLKEILTWLLLVFLSVSTVMDSRGFCVYVCVFLFFWDLARTDLAGSGEGSRLLFSAPMSCDRVLCNSSTLSLSPSTITHFTRSMPWRSFSSNERY